jgi:N-acetylneuraminate synthase/N,N'-diacetyllegionaminate synthase
VLSGAFYVIAPATIERSVRFIEPGATIAYEMDTARSVDIDEAPDLTITEALAITAPIRPVDVGGHRLGTDAVFTIAEAGVNHQGDPTIAHRLIDAAADSGADAVKFQTFDPASLVDAAAPTASYQRSAGEGEVQRAMLERLALPGDAWASLAGHARERGLIFLSTPFDDLSAELLVRLGVPALKVGSGELTNTPFLERLARYGVPLLVSTGMADMLDVARAMDAIAASGDPPVALFHCVSSYPAAPEDANLRALQTLRAAFRVPTGWSDHTPGIEMPIAAVALGAAIIEKHLTLDRTLPGPDHRASLEPDAFRAMVAAIRLTEAALGSGDKIPVAAERDVAAVARRSVRWRRSLAAGESVDEADLVVLRPADGLEPRRLGEIVGRRTARGVRAGAAVALEDVEAAE